MLDMTKAEQRSVRASLTVGGPLAKKLAGIEGEARPARVSPQKGEHALKGKPKSEEHRAAISAALKGKQKGKPKTAAHRAAISAGMKGKPRKPHSDAHRAAISAALRARPGKEAATQVGNND